MTAGVERGEAAVADALRRLSTHRLLLNHVVDLLDAPEDIPTEGSLAGVPFGVKDLFDLAGRTTLAGSVLRDGPAAHRSADAIRLLEAAGAVPVATLAMDELAHGFTTENDHYGVCLNPYSPERIAGGSSGGSAAAVAAGDVPIALGSDTNGSVRVPASLCGVYGMKPGWGRIPTGGMSPLAPSLDHVGVFAGTAAICRVALEALMTDRCSPPRDRPLRFARLGDDIVARYGGAAARTLLAASSDALGGVPPVAIPSLEHAMSASLIVTAAEGAEAHLDKLRTRRSELGIGVRTGLTAGARLSATALVTASRYRSWLRRTMDRLFTEIDVLLVPSTPIVAPRVADERIDIDGVLRNRNPYLGVFTIPFSLVGLPAVSVPVETGAGLPLGVQLVGRAGSEYRLLDVAAQLEDVLGLSAAPEMTS